MSGLPTLPITYLMFLTTEGFAGCPTIYRATLDHTDRQLPLSSFRHRLASIKITPGREAVAEAMTADLKGRGFEIITATAPWQRGLSHYSEYNLDLRRASQHEMVYSTPFTFITDHDYALLTYEESLLKVIYRMEVLLSSSPDILTVRFLREEDKDALASDRVVEIDPRNNLAWHKHFNFQPFLTRSRDFHRVCKIIEDNWEVAQKMHGEALWREAFAPLSRSPKKHAVWLREFAEVINLGVTDYAAVAQRLNLTISAL